MAEILTIDLKNNTPQGEGIEFIEAQMFADRPTPLAVVHYTSHGKYPEYGLRLDLQKRAFLDQPANPKEAGFVRDSALPVAEYIATALDRRDYGILSTTNSAENATTLSASDVQDNERIIAFLEGLTPSDFNRVLLRLPGGFPHVPDGKPHFERVAALIRWVDSSAGPGIPRLTELLTMLFPKVAL
ncbi:MAG: hypothetical protein SFU56_01215 [Capsulimonadales bacterium]|nr:hypothetical protein [Capsulimonadales bacterium]